MIDINLGILVAQIVTFIIAVSVLWKIAWGPLTDMLRAREKRISADIENARLELAKAEVLRVDYEVKLKAAYQEAQVILQESRQRGQLERDAIIDNAKKDAGYLAEQAKEEIVGEKEKMLNELRNDVAALAVEISEKLIKKSIDKSVQEDIINRALKKFEPSEGKEQN